MNIFTGKTAAVALIAGLLIMANFENHASEIDSYLDNAMRTQIFEELEENVRRMYEDTAITPTEAVPDNAAGARSPGVPVADRNPTSRYLYRVGTLN
ncbi:MAG: hypothetical protein OXD47_09310 [Gammaproteobacteria bacterium]|nr:hypothetical protein [Gammaproteobacteria bacterium]MCY4338982.1 hypothetical protein [Gammaproteobacteria bacterium]